MATRFKDDSFQQPGWGFDGNVPKQLDPLERWTPPPLPDWPPRTTPQRQYPWPAPVIDGYPWWVDPQGFPTLPQREPGSENPVPLSARPPTGSPAQSASANWLLSHYIQSLMQQNDRQSGNNVDPNVQDDASQSGLPERRLGRRTYRA